MGSLAGGCRHDGSRTEISRRTEGQGEHAMVVITYRCGLCKGTYEEYA